VCVLRVRDSGGSVDVRLFINSCHWLKSYSMSISDMKIALLLEIEVTMVTAKVCTRLITIDYRTGILIVSLGRKLIHRIGV